MDGCFTYLPNSGTLNPTAISDSENKINVKSDFALKRHKVFIFKNVVCHTAESVLDCINIFKLNQILVQVLVLF